MARPSKYDTHVKPKLDLVQGWARDGLTDEQIAYNLNIAVGTLYEYKKKYPEFTEALRKGKEISDYMIENALFNSALGFHYYEDVVTQAGETVTVQRYAKPNTTAQVFWLKNRRTDKWRDKTEIQADVTQQVIFTGEDDLLD